MTKLVWYKSFERSYKKVIKQNPKIKDKLFNTLEQFVENPFHPMLGTHKLSGKLKQYHAFILGYDCRVVFEFLDNDEVALITIGSHEEVY